ncbi:acyltransferase [Terrisporobacter sp.]
MFKKIITIFKNKFDSIFNKKTQLEYLSERGFKYGRNFNLYNSVIDYGHCFLIEVGDDVTITNSTILAHDATTKMDLGKSKVGKVKIGNRVFIGYGSIVLCNTTIGDDVIVAAGSVVTKDIPNNSVVAGNPAKVICKKTDYISRHKDLMRSNPVYDTFWENKSEYQKESMKRELESSMGYDE